MEPLDGNALAGDLYELFNGEMTTETGICRRCGTETLLAELRVYGNAPGAVARCTNCGSVVFVLVRQHGAPRIHLEAFEFPGRGQPV